MDEELREGTTPTPAEAFDREYQALMDELAESPLPGARAAREPIWLAPSKRDRDTEAALRTALGEDQDQ